MSDLRFLTRWERDQHRINRLRRLERTVYGILWLLTGISLGMAFTGSLAFL